MTLRTLTGVLPVFQTPFNEDETLDVETLEKEIDWLYDCGADGIVMAMVSEVLRLSTDERRKLADLACCFGCDRGAVIISVGAESSVLAERYAKHAQDNGARGSRNCAMRLGGKRRCSKERVGLRSSTASAAPLWEQCRELT